MEQKSKNNADRTNFPETYKREFGTRDGQVEQTEGRKEVILYKSIQKCF